MKAIALLSLTAAGLLSLSGCDRSMTSHRAASLPTLAGGDLVAARSLQPDPASGTAPEPDLPLNKYKLSTSQSIVINLASSMLIGDCLAHHGYSFDPAAAVAQANRTVASTLLNLGQYKNARRYGILSPTFAREHGYHLPANTDTQVDRQSRLNPHGFGRLTDAEVAVINGPDGKSGCAQAAEVMLDGKYASRTAVQLAADAPVVGQISSISYQESMKAPAVQASFASWQACMATRGYHNTSVLTVANDADLSKPEPTAAELRKAQADVACKQATKVISIWTAAESQSQQQLMAAHSRELSAVTERNNYVLQRARDLLGGQRG